MATTETAKVESVDMKLEVVIIPVSDVDRAKAFYEKLGFRLDGDFVVDEKLRVVQFTPPRSEASIIFGKGVTSAKPGSTNGLVLAVDDVAAARADLIARGAEVSEKHANFIVNTGGARAADVRALLEIARDRVWERRGVWLEPEVKLVGEW